MSKERVTGLANASGMLLKERGHPCASAPAPWPLESAFSCSHLLAEPGLILYQLDYFFSSNYQFYELL